MKFLFIATVLFIAKYQLKNHKNYKERKENEAAINEDQIIFDYKFVFIKFFFLLIELFIRSCLPGLLDQDCCTRTAGSGLLDQESCTSPAGAAKSDRH